MNNFGKRLATAAVAIPVIVALCMTGGVLFFLFIALASAVALHEYYGLARAKGARPRGGLGIAAGFVINLSFFYPTFSTSVVGFLHDAGFSPPFPSQTQSLVIATLIIVLVMALSELFSRNDSALLNISTTVFGLLYVSLFFSTFLGLR
jgi:CDP-diglyceride synthetase